MAPNFSGTSYERNLPFFETYFEVFRLLRGILDFLFWYPPLRLAGHFVNEPTSKGEIRTKKNILLPPFLPEFYYILR
jgi:hypothetical protein